MYTVLGIIFPFPLMHFKEPRNDFSYALKTQGNQAENAIIFFK